MSTIPQPRTAAVATGPEPATSLARRIRHPLGWYVLSRLLYLAIALVDSPLRNWSLGKELRNWDGKWYLLAANHGYPSTLHNATSLNPHGYSTLGFEPLYPMLIWAVNQILPGGAESAGVLISLVFGGVATVEMSVLASRWFGAAAARRATIFLCLFPGTIVFSMVYSEGLGLALVAGCLLLLEDRRWVAAGLLAGLATAVAPVLLAIIPACAVVSLLHIRRHGLRDREARRSLAAPVLSVIGAVGFAIYLWIHVGTPLASYKAQNTAWKESSTPLAVYDQAKIFIDSDLVHFRSLGLLNMNLVVGVLGAVFLLWGIWICARRGGLSLGAWVFTLCVALLTLTSLNTPPNPRMLLCAFPVLLAVGARFSGRGQQILIAVTLVVTVAMSIGTFAGYGLRP
jgi:hypothetical protein